MNESRPDSESTSMLTRRQALVLLGAAAAATAEGCGITVPGGSTNGSCTQTPALTEGPYFVDELLNRSDIRTDPTDGTVQPGAELRLKLIVASTSDCNPLADARLDIWHCNSAGLYSDEAANGTVGKKFLRGYQTTDADGIVQFTTIYPGWYSGRTPHIHIKVRSGTQTFDSQLFFDETLTAQVYSQSPYNSRGTPDTPNSRDNIFTAANVLSITQDGSAYTTTFNIAVPS